MDDIAGLRAGVFMREKGPMELVRREVSTVQLRSWLNIFKTDWM